MKSIRNIVPAEFDNQLAKLSSGADKETCGVSGRDLAEEKLPVAISFITQSNQEQKEPTAEGNIRAPREKKQCIGLW